MAALDFSALIPQPAAEPEAPARRKALDFSALIPPAPAAAEPRPLARPAPDAPAPEAEPPARDPLLFAQEMSRPAAELRGLAPRPAAPAEPARTYTDGLLKQRGRQAAAGVIEYAASFPEQAAILRASEETSQKRRAPVEVEAAANRLAGIEATLTAGVSPLSGAPLPAEERAELLRRAEEERLSIENWSVLRDRGVAEARDRPGFKTAADIRAWATDTFGAPDPNDNSFGGMLAYGLGNFAAMAGTAAVPIVGVPLAAVGGMVMSGSEGYRDAIEAGASEDVAQQAAQLNALIGSTEIVPIFSALKVLPARLRGQVTNRLVTYLGNVARNAGEEAAQETAAQIAKNLTASEVLRYDPERGTWEGAVENASVGAVLGGLLGAVGSAPAALRDRPERPEEKRAREAAEDQRLYEEGERVGAEIEALQAQGAPLPVIREAQGRLEKITTEREIIASPIDTDILREGEAVLDAAELGEPLPAAAPPAVAAPATAATPVAAAEGAPAVETAPAAPAPRRGLGVPAAQPVPAEDAALLFGAGYDAETIRAMSPAERAAELNQARQENAQPIDAAEAARRLAETPPVDDGPAGSAGDGAPAAAAPAADEAGAAVLPAAPAAPAPAVGGSGVVALDPATIKADPARFQFKAGGDAAGVTESLTGVRRWNDDAAGVALVWEDKAGERFIVDGHQRLGLAKRLQAEGQNPTLRAIVLREADGVTADDAMFRGAMKNLAEGGESTKAVDVAKVFRRGGTSDAVAASIPPRRQAYRDGLALARLGEDAFTMVVNDRVPAAYAAEVGRQIEGDAAQVAALDYLAKNEPANAAQARTIVGQMKADGFATETQGGLFGESEVASPLFVERARILDNTAKHLRALGRVFKTAIDSESVLSEAGNVLDSAANSATLSENQRLALALERLSQRKGPISDALSEQAQRLARGEVSAGQARQAFLEAVRSADGGAGESGPRVRGRDDRDGAADEGGQVRAEGGRVDAPSDDAPRADAGQDAADTGPSRRYDAPGEGSDGGAGASGGADAGGVRDDVRQDRADGTAADRDGGGDAAAAPAGLTPKPTDPVSPEATAWWKALSYDERAAELERVGLNPKRARGGWGFISKADRARILGGEARASWSRIEASLSGIFANSPSSSGITNPSENQTPSDLSRPSVGPSPSPTSSQIRSNPPVSRNPETDTETSDVGDVPNIGSPAAPRNDYGASNKVFTEDAAKKARALLLSKRSQLNAGIDPEVVQAGITLAGYHIEAGARKFADYARAVVADLGVEFRPYLRSWYEGARYYPGFDATGMTPAAEIDAMDLDAVLSGPAETSREVRAARLIVERLMPRDRFSNRELMEALEGVFGGTVGEGAFNAQDAYNALELAVNMRIAERRVDFTPNTDVADAITATERLTDMVDRLPTQTRRDGEQIAFQQFSTPPAYAYAVNWIAGVRPGERMLEPSAGNGGIAVFAQNAGATVHVNEIADRRVPSLRALGFDRVTTENAEQIANIFDGEPEYDVVVMNPPFSASGTRGGSNTSATGARHIEQALARLRPGGRLVAIMGHTFTPSNGRVRDFFDRVGSENDIRALVTVDGDSVYRKYGTGYDSVVLVIDKTPPSGSAMMTGRADSVPALIRMMEEVANDRPLADTARAPDAPGGPQGGRPDGAGPDGDERSPEREPAPEPDPLRGPGRDGSGSGGRDGGAERAPRRGGASGGRGGGRSGSGSARGADPAARPARGRAGDGGVGPDGARPAADFSEVEQLVVVDAETGAPLETDTGTFASYRPSRVTIEGAPKHPAKLVEAGAMASVRGPRPTYRPQLPKAMIEAGHISEPSLEQVVYAGEAHEQMLPGTDRGGRQVRRGYFIGDGTGVGKTRQIAGIVMDNWTRGRRKAVLVSKDKNLQKDARAEFDAIGMGAIPISDLGKVAKPNAKIEAGDGILFTTYSTIGRATTPGEKSRVQQIAEWLGPDFDGLIVFDEAHSMANALPIKKKRGASKPSLTALQGLELQRVLPNARVVYASATGATEVTNLAYAERLGLWGEGTEFANVQDFVNRIESGGLAAMEVVARDMKQMGLYLARTISFEGVEYDRVTQTLTPDQRDMYDIAARAWQGVLRNINEVIGKGDTKDSAPGKGDKNLRAAALAQFWGTHQRFFNQVLTAMQMPAMFRQIDADLADGLAPVVQMISTNEAATARALGALTEEDTVEDIDITPTQMLMDYVQTSFPIYEYEIVTDADGNRSTQLSLDSAGKPIVSRVAVQKRDRLIAELASIRLPGNPLDMILERYGVDRVAEVTGRSSRIVTRNKKRVVEKWSKVKGKADAGAFQAGKRDVLVFSQAGGTGASYHADRRAKNQKRRAHYVLQAGWRADVAMQGLGRTHRSNQVIPPTYRLVSTDSAGSRRFVATIARRLDQLGALTKGQQDAGGGGMFSAADNLETTYGEGSVYGFFLDAYNGKLEGMDFFTLSDEMGLNLISETTGGLDRSKIPPVPQFLNRVLSLTLDRQEQVFGEFMRRMESSIAYAVSRGTYNTGVVKVEHSGARELARQTVYEKGEIKTEYVRIETRHPQQRLAFEDLPQSGGFRTSLETGRVYHFAPTSTITLEDGSVEPGYIRRGVDSGPYGGDRVTQSEMNSSYRYMDGDRARNMKVADVAKEMWDAELADLPDTYVATTHMVTGALLPVWAKLPRVDPVIKKIELDDGTTILGRVLWGGFVNDTLAKLGVGVEAITMTPAEMQQAVMGGSRINLNSGHSIVRKLVGGEQRMEVYSPPDRSFSDRRIGGPFQSMGMLMEVISGQMRAFIPTGDRGVTVLERFMNGKKITDVARGQGRERFSRRRTPQPDPNQLSPLGTEASAQQLQAARDQQGSGRLRSDKAQRDLDEGLFADRSEEPSLFARRLTGGSPFYSATLRAAEAVSQERGNGLQWLAMIRKQPGVKEEELNWLGLPTWLGDRRGVTKAEVVEYIRANQVQVQEVSKSDSEIDETGQMPMETKFSSYTLPGGENYRELLITMPGETDAFAAYEGDEKVSPDFPSAAEARAWARENGRGMSVRQSRGGGTYKSAHWDEPNILAHIRMNERTIDVPFTAEEQATLARRAEMKPEWDKLDRELGEAIRQTAAERKPRDAARREAIMERAKSGEITLGEANRLMSDFSYLEAEAESPAQARQREIGARRDALVRRMGPEPRRRTERVLFIEEIQSDWHQAGRKKGYAGPRELPAGYTIVSRDGVFNIKSPEGFLVGQWLDDEAAAIQRFLEKPGEVPDGPLKTTWHETAFRRAVAYAAENGFDRVAWTPGEMQAERFDLSKQIREIDYIKQPDGKTYLLGVTGIDGEGVDMPNGGMFTADQLPDVVGKEVAEKIVAGEGRKYRGRGSTTLEGLDLKVGGEGMKGFYDRILPSYAKKWGKKFGAEVGTIEIGSALTKEDVIERGLTAADKTAAEVWSMPITDAMRESVQAEGVPLFQQRDGGVTPALRAALPAVQADLRARLDAYGLQGVTLRLQDTIAGQTDDGAQFSADGYYLDGMIAVALDADARGAGATFTLDHETIHALRDPRLWGRPSGLLTTSEWNVLERAARADAARMADVRETYPDLDAGQQIEEAVAGMFADFQAGRMRATGFLQTAFRKIARFFDALRNALNGQGFMTAADVFERVASGEVGSRGGQPRRADGGSDRALYSRQSAYSQAALNKINAANAAAGASAPTSPAQGTLGLSAPSFAAPERGPWFRLIEMFDDEFHMLQRAQEEIEQARGAPLPESLDAYTAQALYDTQVADRLTKWREGEVTPITKEMRKRGVSVDDIGLYLTARHAPERNAVMAQRDPARFANGGGSGMLDGAAAQIMADFAAAGKTADLDAVASMVDRLIRADLDRRLASGLISQAQHLEWTQMYRHYVPLRGWAERDDEGGQIGRIGQGFSVGGKEVQTAKGRESVADHPLMQAVLMAQEGIIRAAKNKVSKTTLRLALAEPNPDLWIVHTKLPLRSVVGANGTVTQMPDLGFPRQDNVMAAKIGGKAYYIELTDPVLAGAYKKLGANAMPELVKKIQPFTRMFARLQTGANPDFVLPNLQADMMEAALTAYSIKNKGMTRRFAKNFTQAFMTVAAKEWGAGGAVPARWDAYYEEWLTSGGKMDYMAFRDVDEITAEISREVQTGRTSGLSLNPVETVDTALKAVERINQPFESVSRFAMYVAARQGGMSPQKAAMASLDASGRYTRRGKITPTMSGLYAFFNPAVKGIEKFGRIAGIRQGNVKPDVKMLAIMAGALAMGYAMATMVSQAFPDDDDPEGRSLFWKVPSWDRGRALIIPTGVKVEVADDGQPFNRLTFTPIRIAHNLRPLWVAGMGIAGVQSGQMTPKEAAMELLEAMMMNFNPLGSETFLNTIAPTALDPFVDLALNKNWVGQPVRPEAAFWNEGVPPSRQYFPRRTSDWSIAAAQAVSEISGGTPFKKGVVEVYPNEIEYVVDYVTGGFGRFITRGVQFGLDLNAGVETPPDRVPIGRMFRGQTDYRAEAERFYAIRDRLQVAQNVLRDTKKAYENGDTARVSWDQIMEQAADLRVKVIPGKDMSWKNSIVAPISDAEDLIRDMRTQMTQIMQSDLPRADEANAIRQIELRIEGTMRKARYEFVKRSAAITPYGD
jgi:hypothetical protein